MRYRSSFHALAGLHRAADAASVFAAPPADVASPSFRAAETTH